MQVKHDDLKEAAARFVEELVAGKEFIADHKPTQVEVLDQAIKAINDELLSLLGSLHEGLYVDASSGPADVVNSLQQLQERLAQLKVGPATVSRLCTALLSHHHLPAQIWTTCLTGKYVAAGKSGLLTRHVLDAELWAMQVSVVTTQQNLCIELADRLAAAYHIPVCLCSNDALRHALECHKLVPEPEVAFCVLQQAAETYSGYQGLLGLQADEFANLTAAKKEAEGRYAVWKTLLELQEKVIDWTTGPLLSRQDNSVRPPPLIEFAQPSNHCSLVAQPSLPWVKLPYSLMSCPSSQ